MLKKGITSAHSKNPNFSGFNPILQKFYEMICEIVVSKTLCRFFLIFYRLSFINNFMVKNNFLQPKNYWKLNILRPIYLKKKVSSHCFVDLFVQISWKIFFIFYFFQNFISFKDLEPFYDWKTTNLGVIFFHKKLMSYLFFKGYLILT